MAWMDLVLANVASATVLAGIVALAARKLPSPVAHALWLLVLVKLVSVPVLEVEWPAIETMQAASPERAALVGAPATVGAERPIDLPRALALLAGAGAAVVLALAIGRIVRFRRLLARTATTPDSLQERAARVAASLGVRRTPRVRVVPARIPPAVWPGPRGAEILLPAELVEGLAPERLDALLAHELAHVRRRDHWVRALELLITALYWWLPVAWWARHQLRVAEERSCDALVLRAVPGRAREYAESLLETVEFLSVREPVPALAVGASETRCLKERVAMILSRKIPAPVSGRARAAVVASALAALAVSPTWVASEVAPERPDAVYQKERIALHRAELRLAQELHELQMKQATIDHREEERQIRLEQEHLRVAAEELARKGNRAEADEIRRQLEVLEREAAQRLDVSRAIRLHAEKQTELGLELRELQLTREELVADGRSEQAEELAAKGAALERELQELHLRALEEEVRRIRGELAE